jgi:molybdopterin converting factor small subunit
VADTASIGFTHVTGGSRVTFATGMAATQAAEKVVDDLKRRAAQTWDIPVEAVEWKDGAAYPASSNAGAFEPLDLASLALKAARTGGPLIAEVSLNAQGAGPGFGAHICDVSVDKETGHVTINRYTAIQDVGKAIHPSYVEGQIQGGGAGDRLGVKRGIYLQRQGPDGESGLPGLSLPGCLRRADDRGGAGGGAEPPPSVRRAGRGGGADRSADGGDRQRDPRRDRGTDVCSADVAAESPGGARRRWLMPTVVLASGSAGQSFTGGQTEFEVEATNFRRLVLELERRFPGLGKQVEESMAIAIDDEIYQHAYAAELKPDSEIYLIPKIGG